MNASWQKSDERKIALKDLKSSYAGSTKRVSQMSQMGRDMGRSYAYETPMGSDVPDVGKRMTHNKTAMVGHLSQEFERTGEVPTVAATVQELGIPKSTVSRVRLAWMDEQGVS